MKSWIMILCAALMTQAAEKLDVVASVPDLGDMARRIGGDAVNVITLATGREDLHAVPARPSFLPKLNRADLLLTLGLDAEHAWLPPLAAEARNRKIREGGPGWVDCSKGIEVLEIPQKLDRSEGEQHPLGNPHYNIGPQNGATMATNIENAFAEAMPSKAEYFADNAQAYRAEIDSLIADLKTRGAVLDGIAIVEYHPDIVYLSAFYNMNTIGSIEPKAGVPPTAGHLRELERTAKEENVKLIVHNQSQNPKIPRKLAAGLGISSVQIANMVGAQPEIKSWIELQRYNLEALLQGMEKAKQ
jgi:zinc/manganese transport system substrate-binding protein